MRNAFDKVSQDGRALLRGYVEAIIDGGDSEKPDHITFYLHDPNRRDAPVIDERSFDTAISHNLDSDARKKLIHKIMNYLVDDLHMNMMPTDFDEFTEQQESLKNYLVLVHD